MIPVFICSPYSGDVENNVKYAQKACLRAANNGYAPYAPHLYCTQFLNDDLTSQRNLGMQIGLTYMNFVDEIWVCTREITAGMEKEIRHAIENGITIRFYGELKDEALI